MVRHNLGGPVELVSAYFINYYLDQDGILSISMDEADVSLENINNVSAKIEARPAPAQDGLKVVLGIWAEAPLSAY